ncbi:MAG: hypothetical protein QX191_01305 [Methylococcaceae bacterium]
MINKERINNLSNEICKGAFELSGKDKSSIIGCINKGSPSIDATY